MIQIDLLKNAPIFRNIGEDLVRLVARSSSLTERVAAGETLFEVGDQVADLFMALRPRGRSGPIRIRVEIPVFGPAKAMRFERIVENELFGEFEFFSTGMRPTVGDGAQKSIRRETKALALSACDLVAIPITTISEVLAGSELFRQRFIASAAKRLRMALESQIRLRHVDLDASLADYLLDLAVDYATLYDNHAIFNSKITQEDIASDLGVSRRALTERLGSWVESGLIRTTPLILSDLNRLEQLRRLGLEEPRKLAGSVQSSVMSTIDAGNLTRARAIALDFLKHFPASAGLAFAAALAAARAGSPDDARELLSAYGLWEPVPGELVGRIIFGMARPAAQPNLGSVVGDAASFVEDYVDDEEEPGAPANISEMRRSASTLAGEILSLRARIAKDLAFASGDAAEASEAADLYLASDRFLRRADAYQIVNAASLAMLAGDVARGRALAAQALDAVSGHDYWALASKTEALLVLGRWDEAAAAATDAMGLRPGDGMTASTRRQLGALSGALPGKLNAVMRTFQARVPIVYSGVMIRAKQFEDDDAIVEQSIVSSVKKFFQESSVGSVHGSLACGSDIIIAEQAIEFGCEIHVVLPFDANSFLKTSVNSPDGSNWAPRFEAVLSQCSSLTIAQPGRPAMRDLDTSFRHGFRCAAAAAISKAVDLNAEPLLLAVTAPGPAGAHAGASADMTDWIATGRRVERIALPHRKKRLSGRASAGSSFAATVFCFSENELVEPIELCAARAGVAATEVRERRTKDGRRSAAVAFSDLHSAVAFAFAVSAADRFSVVCDYGPVFNQAGRLDDDLLGRMAGSSDFFGFPKDYRLATSAFASEALFAGLDGVRSSPLEQRSLHTGGSRVRVSSTTGVHRLVRPAAPSKGFATR